MSGKSKSNASKKFAFERKQRTDGSANPKYVDLLELDKPIAGQQFGCFSFITPEKILKQKEMFFFESFLKKWEFSKSMEKFHQFINFVSYKYKLNFEDVMKDYEGFVTEERENIINSSIEDDYKTFLDKNEDDLEKQFSIKHNFQTSVRGFKTRGNFQTQEEAEMRAKLLRETDPSFDVFVGPVGQWLCWDPEAYKTGRVEYMEEELNQLAQEKQKNEVVAKSAFDQRVKETKQKAIDDNKKNAEKHGSSLTQDIDNDGNLVGVANSQESKLSGSSSISVADIRSELFDGDNIVMGQSDYGRSELLSGPFALSKDDKKDDKKEIYNGSFQFTTSRERSWIHADAWNNWAGVVYLTPDAPLSAGTAFYRFKNGEYSEEDAKLLNTKDQTDSCSQDLTKWEQVDKVGNVFNRLILFNSKRFHMSMDYFGDSKENGRLFQVFFFSTER